MCVHCGEEGDKQPSRKSHPQPSCRGRAALGQVAGVLRGNEHHGDTNEMKQATERNHRLPLSHRLLSYQLAQGNQWGARGCGQTRR